jgi:hypothetical protein
MKTLKLGIGVVGLALGLAGCGVSVEAEVPEVEVTQRDLMFDGVAQGALLGDVALSHKFSQKHKKLDFPDGVDSEVKALGVTLTAKSGIKDFSFLKSLRIAMSDDVHPAVLLVDYQQTPGTANAAVLEMITKNPVNTFDQWKTDSATFTIDVMGTLPADPWKVDLAIRFGGSISYKK